MSTTTLPVNAGSFPAVSVAVVSIVRTDTMAVIATSGTFTALGGNTFAFTFTDPVTPALIYAYQYTILFMNGQSVTPRPKLTGNALPGNVLFVNGIPAAPSSASLISETVTLTNETVTLTPG